MSAHQVPAVPGAAPPSTLMTIAPRRHLTAARDAGFPYDLLLPILPFDAAPVAFGIVLVEHRGKCPAFLDGNIRGWQRWWRCAWSEPVHETDWRLSDEAGANAGLILGKATADIGKFIFVDFDFRPKEASDTDPVTKFAQRLCDLAVRALAQALDVEVWRRHTRQGRAGVLLRLPASAMAGAKLIYKVSHPDYPTLEKIEILTAGQQVVIGGRHQSGTPIFWERAGQVENFPDIETVPVVADFDAVIAAMKVVTTALEADGVAVTRGTARAPAVPGAVSTTTRTAAPDVQSLVALLNALPNPARVQRDSGCPNYIAIMFAAAGALQAMPETTQEDRERVKGAAVNWACRWAGPNPGTWAAESEKWDNDWYDSQTGWTEIINAAENLVGDAAVTNDVASIIRPIVAAHRREQAQAEFIKLVPSVPMPVTAHAATDDHHHARPGHDDVIDIFLGSDLAVTARGIATLLAEKQKMFDFGGRRSVVAMDGRGHVTISELQTDDIPHLAASICRVITAKKDRAPEPVTMPRDLRALVLSAPSGPCEIPVLTGIAAAPILDDRGAIRGGNGYDPATGLYVRPVPVLEVPEAPTIGDARTALLTIRGILKTFPFADATTVANARDSVPTVNLSAPPGVDESAALVALLTAVCRPSLRLAPGLMVTAPEGSGSGAGKGLLVRVISVVAYGTGPRAFTCGRTAEELDKRIGSELMGGDPIMLLDNCNGLALRSDTLASVLTEAPARFRVLGHSKMVELSSRTFVAVTGNGLSPSEDLVRRFIVCRLDARVENAGARAFPDGPDRLLATVQERRGELLSAALTIWRWGRLHALPPGVTMGSYETWARWCRDPLLALSSQDPVARLEEARAQDPYRQRLEDGFEGWWAAHGSAPLRASEVIDCVRCVLDPKGHSRNSFAALLARLRGTRAAGFALETEGASKGRKMGTRYRLQWVGDGPAPTVGPASPDPRPLI